MEIDERNGGPTEQVRRKQAAGKTGERELVIVVRSFERARIA
jgi:hypothetical protein